MSNDESYQAWIEQRRAVSPSSELTDRIMQAVEDSQSREELVLSARFALWIERSRLARFVACSVAMLVGSTPFVAYLAYLLVP